MSSVNLSRSDLHQYQLIAAKAVVDNPCYGLWLTMGLGKTVSTLTAIRDLYDDFVISRVLIIAPLRVALSVWPQEIEQWSHTGGLSVNQLAGLQPSKRETRVRIYKDITIINRELVPWLVEYWGREWPYDMVVIDESSSFKNHASKRFKALKKVRGLIDRVVLLTGSPAPNGLIDLWAPLWLLDRGEALGKTITKFRQSYFQQDYMGWNWILRDGCDERIHEKIDHLAMSMDKVDYLENTPVVKNTVEVSMPAKCLAQYDYFKNEMIVELQHSNDTLTALSAAAVSSKCLQMANGAVYTEESPDGAWFHDAKLDALQEIIDSAEGSPVLVAYSFKHDKDRILKRFKNAKLLDKEPQTITDWNEGKIPILVLHPASGGHGLNLQRGGHILTWFGLPWSLELYEQLNARLDRQGQTETVFIYHILTAGTLDSNMLAVLEGKKTVQQALLEYVRHDGSTKTLANNRIKPVKKTL